MVKRKSLKGDYCPSARSLDAIGDWWSLLIVRDAFDGLTRFGEFQKSLGIAKNILSARLRTLIEKGILETAPAPGGAHQEYHLTEKGRALFPVMVALRHWGERYLFAPDEKRSVLVDRRSGQRVSRLEIRTEEGHLVDPDEAVIIKVPETAES
ncbi:helix-turn-helix domain-containing protein [Aquamicrobium sp. LC103]|uniref:winged helix-turn-helix transcriptional regulator n=1 Tax=Aquamicrobium sp. LC103 TaxID=1120658 RepID=UPI00063EBEE1|nr:helix-turn-helix domain-containing protein [Aquamicrobium sp. LC103]TKT75297.1 helix-turn-helix transcriptional regulator [Aquamicrobium sp. LC103]